MKATVYFLKVDADTVNAKGWGCPEGQRYLAAKSGDISQGDYEVAARLDGDNLNGKQAEHVWMMLQNMDTPWTDRAGKYFIVETDFPRSMDIGDYIEWEDGTKSVVDIIGFKEYKG